MRSWTRRHRPASVRHFEAIFGGFDAAAAPALARLLRASPALPELRVAERHDDGDAPLLDEDAAATVAAALRANATLTSLDLHSHGQWADPAAAATLLFALTAHPSVRQLYFCWAHLHGHEALAGQALGALIAANAPALRELLLHVCPLGAAGLAPLFDALRRNTHLTRLDVDLRSMDVDAAERFAEEVVLPAVRVNTSLTLLRVFDGAGRRYDPLYDDGVDAEAQDAQEEAAGVDAVTRAQRFVLRRAKAARAAA
jgi:hypothetical protein